MPDAQWKTISDFSPGIRSNLSGNHPPGTASPEGTYGCYAVPGNSLGPLPRAVEIPPPTTYFLAGVETNLIDVSNIVTEEFRIAGLHARGPVFYGPNQTSGTARNNSEILVCLEYATDDATDPGDTRWRHMLLRYRLNWTSPRWDHLNSEYRDLGEDSALVSNPTRASLVNIRSNSADPQTIGPVVTAVATGQGSVYCTPDDTATTTDSVAYLPGDYTNDPAFAGLLGVAFLAGHQGRLVEFPVTPLGVNSLALWASAEQFFWTTVNDVTTISPNISGPFSFAASYTDPVGYQVVGSLTADELFLVKTIGGAVVVRGDLDDPTIINYPYVRSTGFSLNNGAPTPSGYAYPVDGGGAWMWTGGQVANPIALHLEDDFWKVPLLDSTGTPVNWDLYPTQCSAWGEYVMFPNNWMFDPTLSEEGGWWRLYDPDTLVIHKWYQDWRGVQLYGTPSGFRSGADPCVLVFDKTATPTRGFTWVSHPMSESLNRETGLEEVVIVASGLGEVTVTASTAEDPVGSTAVFPIDGTEAQPQFIRQRVPTRGTQLTFSVVSEATDPDDPAPTIHEIRYSITQPANQIVNT